MASRRISRWRPGRLLGGALAVVGLAALSLVAWRVFDDGAENSGALTLEFGDAYLASAVASGQTAEFDLVAEPTMLEVIPGSPIEVWAYNGTVPGPELRIELGDTVVVNLTNRLPQPTSIHWHGVRVPNSMDGVPGVNQDPVEPGGSFRYEFTPPDAGTFWFHSHTRGSEQLERGLYGALIVDDPGDPGYSQDVTWIVDDWQLETDGTLVSKFNDPHDITHNGRWGNSVTVNSELGPVLEARPGERLRLRLINASNARVYTPDFGDLDAQLVAVDGLAVSRVGPASRFVLAPGNRIDVDIKLPADPGSVDVTEDFNGEGFLLGTITYQGDAVEIPEFAYPINEQLPAWIDAVTANVDHEYLLDIQAGAAGEPEWAFDGRTFDDPATLTVTQGEFAKIRLDNVSQVLHPIHIHGQFFKVVSRNGEPIDDGYFRDTVLLYPGEIVDIAMVPLDEGTWIIHCHIQEHAEAGMITLLDVVP